MRAVLCRAFGDTLTTDEVADPEPGDGEVLIEVRRAGVNFPDTLITKGLYQTRPQLPFSPGFEVAGRVAALGNGVTSVRVGDPVMATFEYGGYAELAVAEERTLVPLRAGTDWSTAAAFPIAYGTVYHALVDRGRLTSGETLLVTGASGGVGLAAVQVGILLGATVLAAVGSEWKAKLPLANGAAAAIDYSKEDLRARVKELTEGRGVDVIFDPVGGDVFDRCVRAVSWAGRLLVVGFASGRIPEIPANLVLLKGSSIVGVFWGSFAAREPEASRANFEVLGDWLESGELRPYISATYPLERAAEALASVAARQATGKVVLEVSDD